MTAGFNVGEQERPRHRRSAERSSAMGRLRTVSVSLALALGTSAAPPRGKRCRHHDDRRSPRGGDQEGRKGRADAFDGLLRFGLQGQRGQGRLDPERIDGFCSKHSSVDGCPASGVSSASVGTVSSTQDFLNSDEQQLELRTTIGGGGGRYLLRSSSQYLAAGGGLAWTNERYTDATAPTTDSGGAYAGTEFMTERLKVFDLVTRLTWYPSLTIDNRYRLNYKLNFDFSLPGDWYGRIGYFDNYDSLPPTATSKNDCGWSNALGLKF